jgi:HNH endonuclease
MKARGFWTLVDVSDAELEANLRDLLRDGARTEARVVAHLAEVDARRLHLRGAQSLFEYCQARLGFSESEAWYRICAARAATQFPIIFELLERRQLHLTAVALLAKHLTRENHLELLNEVRGKTKRQILELLARRAPKSGVASHIRKLPLRAGAVAAGPTGVLEPLSADAYRLQLNVSQAFQQKLELARDLVSHANPSGDLAAVVERALDLLIEAERARRFGQTKRPLRTRNESARSVEPSGRASSERGDGGTVSRANGSASAESGQPESGQPHPGSTERRRRHISSDVRRQVIARDGQSCSYVSPAGQRCSARAFLELDHVQPWAKGGGESVENLRLLCRAHNQFLAEREFGAEVVRQVVARRRRGRAA